MRLVTTARFRSPALALTLTLVFAAGGTRPVPAGTMTVIDGKPAIRLSAIPAPTVPAPRTSLVARPSPGTAPGAAITSPTVTILNNGGNGVTGLDFNQSGGYTPPDPQGAAGPTGYVETVNQTIALRTPKNGSPVALPLSTFYFTVGALPHASTSSFLSDPVVTYNAQIGRFIVGDQDVDFNTHVSRFDIAVSRTSTPASLNAADWFFFSVNTTESGFDADYPGNFGWNHDATVITLNMFGVVSGGHALVISLDNASLVAMAPVYYLNDLNDFSDRPTVIHDGVAGGPMWLVTEHGDNVSLDVIRMTNVLSASPTFTYTNLSVTPYSMVQVPRNPNGTSITFDIDSRILKAAEWNGRLVAAHHVAATPTQDVVQWYNIDVSGATPALLDQGRVTGGNNTYFIYPGVDINGAGQIGMTYMRSGTDTPTDFLSMYVTGRNPGDPPGTMQPPALVPLGTGQANYVDFAPGGRAGDLSGINVDPGDGSFWAVNEFANTEANANWGTAIANFTILDQVTPTMLALFDATRVAAGVELRWQFGPGSGVVGATVERSENADGPWVALGAPALQPDGTEQLLDTGAAPDRSFLYHLRASLSDGSQMLFGPVSVAASATDAFALLPANPSTGPTRIAYVLPRAERLRLSVLDVQGRQVASLVNGPVEAGRHEVVWSAAAAGAARSGLYFVRMEWPEGSIIRRVALAR